MDAWWWIGLGVVVAAIGVWLGRRGTFGAGYRDDHQKEREANRQRFNDPRGRGPGL